MINTFMRAPEANSLAVLVLIALIVTWITSLALGLRENPIPKVNGSYSKLLPTFALLGIPAVLDLLQTSGIAILFAAIVFVVLVLNIVIPILGTTRKLSHPLVHDWYRWAIPISALGGLAVAGYITFVESTGGQVSCGPSAGCPLVQNSPYAMLFGVLPVGVLGLVGFITILGSWIVWQFGSQGMRKAGILSIWGMCIFGVLFSTYLTFLEPFVIGATCMWCISSAVLMMILLLAANPAAQQAFTLTDEE